MSKIILPFLFIISLIACCIEVDISAPSFPDLAHYFETSEGTLQLTIAYNLLGFCLASLIYGPLSECYGRRKVMIVGNAILLFGAVGCVLSPTIHWLLRSRFIQGVGASTSAVVVFAIIADIYKGEKAVQLVGLMNSVLTMLIALSPVLGGFINIYFGWRGNYAIVAIISLVSWLSLLALLPETQTGRTPLSLKKVLIDYRQLLTSTPFVASSLIPSLLYAAYLSFVGCAPFLYMETFDFSIITYALHQGAIVACFAVISCFTGHFINLGGTRRCITLGLLLCLVGSTLFAMLGLMKPSSPYLITLCMILFDIGFAICYPVIFAASLEIFPEIKGTASSAIMGMRAFVCAGLVGLTGYLYNGHPLSIATVIFCTSVLCWVLSLYILGAPDLAESLAKK